MAVGLKVDQIIAGTVLNIAALGLTSFYDRSRSLGMGKYTNIDLGPLADIPLIGTVFFSRPPLTYLTMVLLVVVHVAFFRSVWGMRTRAIGEHPGAADTVGIDVLRLRYFNVTIAGGLAGLEYIPALEAVETFESMSAARVLSTRSNDSGRRTPLELMQQHCSVSPLRYKSISVEQYLRHSAAICRDVAVCRQLLL